MNNRYKNPWFWIGLIGIMLSAAGIDPSTFTTWDVLFDSLLKVVQNPYMLFSVAMAITGVFVDPTTPGINDNKLKINNKK